MKKQQTKVTTDNALFFTGRVSFRFSSTTMHFPSGGFLLVFYRRVGCAVSYQKNEEEELAYKNNNNSSALRILRHREEDEDYRSEAGERS